MKAKYIDFTRGGDPYKKLKLGRFNYKKGDLIASAWSMPDEQKNRNNVWVEVTEDDQFTVGTTTDGTYNWGGVKVFDSIEEAMVLFYKLAGEYDEMKLDDKYYKYYK